MGFYARIYSRQAEQGFLDCLKGLVQQLGTFCMCPKIRIQMNADAQTSGLTAIVLGFLNFFHSQSYSMVHIERRREL